MKDCLTGPGDINVNPVNTIKDDVLIFHGVIRDEDAAAVEGAVVMVFAYFQGGTEKVLGYTFTNEEGEYFVSVFKPPDCSGLTGFKIRAGKVCTPREKARLPVHCPTEQGEEFRQDLLHEKEPEEEYVSAAAETKGETAAYGAEPLQQIKAGESEEPRPDEASADRYAPIRGEADLPVQPRKPGDHNTMVHYRAESGANRYVSAVLLLTGFSLICVMQRN